MVIQLYNHLDARVCAAFELYCYMDLLVFLLFCPHHLAIGTRLNKTLNTQVSIVSLVKEGGNFCITLDSHRLAR